jgi:hypothetical protein
LTAAFQHSTELANLEAKMMENGEKCIKTVLKSQEKA